MPSNYGFLEALIADLGPAAEPDPLPEPTEPVEPPPAPAETDAELAARLSRLTNRIDRYDDDDTSQGDTIADQILRMRRGDFSKNGR